MWASISPKSKMRLSFMMAATSGWSARCKTASRSTRAAARAVQTSKALARASRTRCTPADILNRMFSTRGCGSVMDSKGCLHSAAAAANSVGERKTPRLIPATRTDGPQIFKYS